MNLEEIKKIVEEFFKKTTFDVEIDVLPLKDQTLPLNIKTEEPRILIGENGQTLLEIQHLLRIIIFKKIGEQIFVDLDINDYKKNKIEYLKELAKSVSDEVALTKKEKILSPMFAYERRIIHLELAQRTDIVAESIGKEPERRIVIRPYP